MRRRPHGWGDEALLPLDAEAGGVSITPAASPRRCASFQDADRVGEVVEPSRVGGYLVARGFDGEAANSIAYSSLKYESPLAGLLRVLFPGLTFARLGGDNVTFGAENSTASIGCGGEFGGYAFHCRVAVSTRSPSRRCSYSSRRSATQFPRGGRDGDVRVLRRPEKRLLHTAMADRGADTKRPVASDLEVGIVP